MIDSLESRLLARAQHGDPVAFEELVKMHQQRVFAHCYRLVNNCAEAEDLSAEAFLRAYEHLQELRADTSIVHWLLRVGNNLAISLLRKRSTRPTVELDEARDVPGSRPTPEDEVIMRSRQEVVRRCMQQLSVPERTAVLMFYLEERSLDEIATVLGCGLAGAKSRVHRARRRLKTMVESELGDGWVISPEKEG